MADEGDPDYSEFDEQHRDWLMRDSLELYALFCLAHGISPRWPVGRPDLQPRWGALKSAIKAFPETFSHRPDGLDRLAIIGYDVLLNCLKNKDAHLDWLRKFAARWQACRRIADVNGLAACAELPSPRKAYKRWDWSKFKQQFDILIENEGIVEPGLEPGWSQARLVEKLTAWAVEQWQDHPQPSQLNKKVSEWLAGLRGARKLDKVD
jgi:hypothetical protein